MSTNIKYGTIKEVINKKIVRYKVYLDDGKIIYIEHNVIKPERKKYLQPGARLSVTYSSGKVFRVSTDLSSKKSKKDQTTKSVSQKQNILVVGTVTNVDPMKGIATFSTDSGEKIRLRLPKHHFGWKYIFLGHKFNIECTYNNLGKLRYELILPKQKKKSETKRVARSRPARKGRTVQPKKSYGETTTGTYNYSGEKLSYDNTIVSKSRDSKRKIDNTPPPEIHDQATPDGENDYIADEKIESERVGIDPEYFKDRKNENHRYEIMAFLEEHLKDELIEWYEMRAAQEAKFREPTKPLSPALMNVLRSVDNGFKHFYKHQASALDSIRAGQNVVIITQTASGKTMCYNPAVFEHICKHDPSAHAMYIFPLNALMMDQKEKIDQLRNELANRNQHIQVEHLIGGLGREKRLKIARNSPNIIATNPELLSVVLNELALWEDYLSNLRYIVVDEVHSYRGILGMHMAGLLRRLLLATRRLGNEPQFILSSATVSNPMDLVTRLTSLPESSFDLLDENHDGSEQAFKHWAILNPDAHQDNGVYDSFLTTASLAMVALMNSQDRQGQPSPLNTILFAKSIRDVNKAYKIVLDNLRQVRPDLVSKVRKYVSAELNSSEKREIYAGLKSGELIGVVSTNALEAGIDIGHLDACVIAGFPFFVMTMRQMAGRVGRHDEGLVLFVPHPVSPVDQYYRNHPDLLLSQPPEVFVVDQTNPYISRKHINAAAYAQGTLSRDELSIFSPKAMSTVEQAVRDGVMRSKGNHFTGTKRNYKNIKDPYAIANMRSQPQIPYVICHESEETCRYGSSCLDANLKDNCDRKITVLDQQYAYRDCHPGAIYEGFDGTIYKVTVFDSNKQVAQVIPLPEDTLDRTFVEDDITISIIGEPKASKKIIDGIELNFGDVIVTRSFTGYYTYQLIPRRRCRKCKQVYDVSTTYCSTCHRTTTKYFDNSKPQRQDFPEPYQERGFKISLDTVACWMTISPEVEEQLYGASPCKLPGESNRVTAFLREPLNIDKIVSRIGATSDEKYTVESYYENGEQIVRNVKKNNKETLLFPGIYEQCLLTELRQFVSESRALEIFQALTGYPVTDDLKHICRKCMTSVLFPAMHTLEHTVKLRYPSVALGDPSDISSLTTLGHSGTGKPTIFWYDNYEGGLGAAEKIYEQLNKLLEASQKTLAGCNCTTIAGCPYCTQMGHCNIRNEALSKPAAQILIAVISGNPYSFPFEPFVYGRKFKEKFSKSYKENEFSENAHGIGDEAPESQPDELPIDPYILLRLQKHVHDPVLNKAFEIRSTEIINGLPPISAKVLSNAFQKINSSTRPSEWKISPGMTIYQILEILPSASLRMIGQIYRVIAREVHPDTFPGNKTQANEMMKLVNDAYNRIQKEKHSNYSEEER